MRGSVGDLPHEGLVSIGAGGGAPREGGGGGPGAPAVAGAPVREGGGGRRPIAPGARVTLTPAGDVSVVAPERNQTERNSSRVPLFPHFESLQLILRGFESRNKYVRWKARVGGDMPPY